MAYLSVNNISISMAFVRQALVNLPLSTSDIDALLVQCRIASSLLHSPQARLSLTQFGQVMTRLVLHSKDELLGYGSTPLPLGSLSLLLHWLLPAQTLLQALQRLEDFHRILGRGIGIEWQVRGGQVYVCLDSTSDVSRTTRHISGYSFFFYHRIVCWLIREIVPVRQVRFPFPQPDYGRDYRLMFYGAPVEFNASQAELVFPEALLERAIVQNQEALDQLLKDPFRQLLMLNFNHESWTSRVAEQVQEQLAQPPTLPQLAEQLHIAPHTLQRRLSAEGTSYLAIKNQIKRDSAIELLVNSRMSIEAISERLGFSETSPFTRTFKEWTGVPPSAYRKHR